MAHWETNPLTGRAVKVYDSLQEKLDEQNQRYHQWRKNKLETDPVKLAEFRKRKNEASKKCLAKKKQQLDELKARVAELEKLNS